MYALYIIKEQEQVNQPRAPAYFHIAQQHKGTYPAIKANKTRVFGRCYVGILKKLTRECGSKLKL